MNYRQMGRTGLRLSEISLGAWITFGDQIDEGTAGELLHQAHAQGVNFFDNADVYARGAAESVMGAAIRGLPRSSLVVSSKVFWPTMEGPNGRGLSRKHIFESCHASLRRLGIDYLDLYFCHRFDREVPLDETVRAMDDLVTQGKVLYWGTSEWTGAQIGDVNAIARDGGWEPPRVEQPQYNLLVRRRMEEELIPLCSSLGFGMVTFSPLRSGVLSGKYGDGGPADARLNLSSYAGLRDARSAENLERVRSLTEVAGDLACTPAQLAIAWILRLPQVTSVITGATRLSQLQENLKAAEVVTRLTADVLGRLEEVFPAGEGR
jgi:voltage-dependent potassium channel beta subunit